MGAQMMSIEQQLAQIEARIVRARARRVAAISSAVSQRRQTAEGSTTDAH